MISSVLNASCAINAAVRVYTVRMPVPRRMVDVRSPSAARSIGVSRQNDASGSQHIS
jgi:hypothetical protein